MPGEPILVVDDNPMNVKLICFLLRKRGYEVRAANDATQALATLDSFSPRLILMDLQLPGVSGLELTRRIKASENTRAIPIIAVTAFAMKGDEAKAFEAGCDGYITKPIDTHTFPTVIHDFLSAGARA